jgi:hypothetical protein
MAFSGNNAGLNMVPHPNQAQAASPNKVRTT